MLNHVDHVNDVDRVEHGLTLITMIDHDDQLTMLSMANYG